MSVFEDVLKLLTGPPGGLVYYLVVLFSVWAIVGLAWSRWARGERREIVPRLLIAGALLSLIRFAPVVLALLDRQSSDQVLILFGPPLERFVDALSVTVVCWAFVLAYRGQTVSRAFLGVSALFSVGLYVIAAADWFATASADPAAIYNATWQNWVWELWQLVIIIPTLGFLIAVPVPEQGMLIVATSVLAAGCILQVIYPLAAEIPDVAGWSRFANLLAYPLLAVVTYRLIVQRYDEQANNLQRATQESLAQITGLMALLDTGHKMSSSLDLEATLDSAVRGISQALQSNLCALLLTPQRPDDQAGAESKIELSVVYEAPHVTQVCRIVEVTEYPALQYALTRNKPAVLGPRGVEPADDSDQVAQIYRLLNSESSGPLIIQPLERESRVIGLILVCRPGLTTPFSAADARKCETLATHVSTTVENAREYQWTREHIAQLSRELGLVKTESTRTVADLQNRLKKSREEATVYIQKLYDTEASEAQAQNALRGIQRELARVQEESRAEVARSEAELQNSIQQAALLTNQLAKLDAERRELKQLVENLEQEKGELQFQLAVAATTQGDFTLGEEGAALGKGQAHGEGVRADILDQLACGALLCDPQGQITHVNAAGARLLGYEAEQIVGESAFALWNDSSWQSAVHQVTDECPTERAPVSDESPGHADVMRSTEFDHIALFFAEGGGRFLQAELAPLYIDGSHAGAVVTLHDAQQANERIRARDEFLASLAQDLRTPMTSILGYTELLMNESVGKLGGIQRKFLQRVQANVERMSGMLSDLIGVTAIDSGKLVIELEPVDIVNVVETGLRKVQFRLEEKELSAKLELGDLPVVFADPECVQQIVDNLLTNACKSSESGTTIVLQANVETDDAGGSHLHVAVSDTGGGIAPEDQSRVFERFYRADSALIAGLGETGVGLAIVKSLVEAHHGQVWNDSEMGVGTTFHFTLPLGLEKHNIEPSSVPEGRASRGNGRG